jgi:hypothetical protein
LSFCDGPAECCAGAGGLLDWVHEWLLGYGLLSARAVPVWAARLSD